MSEMRVERNMLQSAHMQPREHNGNALRTWVDVDTTKLHHNYEKLRALVPKNTLVAAAVKSNAYGHSIRDYAKVLDRFGIDWFCVDSLVEGVRLREQGIEKPILVLGYTLPDMYAKAARNDICVTVANLEALREVTELSFDDGRYKLKIHLKLDTGMHRQGIFEYEIEEAIELLSMDTEIELNGLYTHFPNAKNPSDPAYTRNQIKIFERVRTRVREAGFDPICHTAATSGTIIYPESHYDLVRIGIGMYGLWPSEPTRRFAQSWLPLEPILSWKTVVSDVKKVPANAQFGYGLTESVSKPSTVAVLPVGYWHGYARSLSSISQVLIRGKRAKILGTISMDITVVDVTDIPDAATGDEATLIGQDGEDEISADEIASMTGTINYEVVTRINPQIKRFYY